MLIYIERRNFMKKLWNEFKDFAIQGNMVDMAVGIVIGGAFTSVVKDGLVNCLVTPLINWLIHLFTGSNSIDNIAGNIGPFPIGTLLGTIINFLITAVVLFSIIKVINKIKKPAPVEEAPKTKECPYCKSEVNIEATRCPHCTSEIE